MDADFWLKAVIATAPVLTLLLVFDRLDVFNLISIRAIALLTAAGGLLAALSFFANWRVMDGFPIGFGSYSRYVAPAIEECLKALPIVALFAVNRLGFKLDAAIAGFAVGAGFSMVENGWYLREFGEANLSAWLVRGFGTAVMHGGATAIFAVIAHEMTERQAAAEATAYRLNLLLFLPGLAAAMMAHSAFNHFPNHSLAVMALTMCVVPVTLFLTLSRSERATHEWLKDDHEVHRKALQDLREGRFAESEAGRKIRKLTERFRGSRAEDAFAYVTLKTELVLRAEELILARQRDEEADVSEADRRKFEELDAVKRRLGRPALAAIGPYLGFSRNDMWEVGRLRARVKAAKTATS
ncbi:MAG: PrsW family glutamic-type intramembrane protease [Parvularculaceae bacterium]